MKRTFRKLSAFLLALVTAFSLTIPAYAAGGSLTINGKNSFTCKPGISTATDLFDEQFKNVMPGDKISETIAITSRFSFQEDSLKVYMRAVTHGSGNLPVTGGNAADMADFLNQLTLRVYNQSKGGTKIFEGKAGELDGLKSNVYLGSFRKGGKILLRVELEVPVELGNEYANRTGEVDWVFTVEAFDDPAVDNPKTGDYILMAAAAMALSGAVLVLLLIRKKRKA